MTLRHMPDLARPLRNLNGDEVTLVLQDLPPELKALTAPRRVVGAVGDLRRSPAAESAEVKG